MLYVDGSVRWMATNFCSNDPVDDIYAEGGECQITPFPGRKVFWCADTDSFVIRGSVVLGPSWGSYYEF